MKRTAAILFNIGYWIMYCLLLFILLAIMSKGHIRSVEWTSLVPVGIFCFLPALLGFYSFYAVLFDRYLHPQRIGWLLAAGMVTVMLCGLVTVLALLPWKGMVSIWLHLELTVVLALLAAIHGIIGLVLKGFISWYNDIKLKEELNRKNYEISMALIKAQINPHFLFNTINNIDVLIAKDADKASLYLNKLSGIMRFMLYETKAEMIPLSREMTYIDQYIDLQRIRSSNARYVTYEVTGTPDNRMIAPMLFISYIENAFKHAEHKKSENAIYVRVQIEAERLVFVCRNLYSIVDAAPSEHNGLGNELLRKRLALLYPDRHVLDITREAGVYQVNLTIQDI
ncbi:sensor histidine kinase [Chitinophaga qingshengii]|uniref:Sensor histidine kinase n=1 Tax=Chitinophaga qingshengii TaxID=1569794 RepID=A0ABR7TZ10_9BACT|nr:sensor histidine kinase [Chitinophaga qingshengii]MBC9934509.1 sensor histidine kinase [Chitinophaga qingshengii]